MISVRWWVCRSERPLSLWFLAVVRQALPTLPTTGHPGGRVAMGSHCMSVHNTLSVGGDIEHMKCALAISPNRLPWRTASAMPATPAAWCLNHVPCQRCCLTKPASQPGTAGDACSSPVCTCMPVMRAVCQT